MKTMLEINEVAKLEKDELIAYLVKNESSEVIARALNIPPSISSFLIRISDKDEMIKVAKESLEKEDKLTILLRAYKIFDASACYDASYFSKRIKEKLEEMKIDNVSFISFETKYRVHDADLQYFHFIRDVKLLDENKNEIEYDEEELEDFIEDELEFLVQEMFTDNYDMEIEMPLF
jgi:hypothetical protein